MSNTYSEGLYFCVAAMYWTLNDKSPELNATLPEKDDYQTIIHHYIKYKKVIRLNNVTIKTHYPNLVEQNTTRKNHFEIKFKRQKNNKKRRYV